MCAFHAFSFHNVGGMDFKGYSHGAFATALFISANGLCRIQ